MKLLFSLLFLISFSAVASPGMSVKEKLRLHLWYVGFDEQPAQKKIPSSPLPEELQRALKKM